MATDKLSSAGWRDNPPAFPAPKRKSRVTRFSVHLVGLVCVSLVLFTLNFATRDSLLGNPSTTTTVPIDASAILAQCRALDAQPGPPSDFHERTQSDRYQPGTKPVLIRNAKIWTGRVEGLETLQGDILLDGGIIKAVGEVDEASLAGYENLTEFDAQGAWVSPGIVDIHSHIGVYSAPSLNGAKDGNSLNGPILPWLRAVDALNTHDDSIELAVAGGQTTSLILPGSANAIGGQGYVIKLRQTTERSPTSLLLEPPTDLNGTEVEAGSHLHWKHMKHACGENPARVYGDSRMDSVWAWREAYNTARKIKTKQDEYCVKAQAGKWEELGDFPTDFKWAPLVDILRGKVKVQTHCYEALDIDNFVRLTNEFQFPVAAFHHAHEAYLVPETMKRAYGSTPAVAIFAAFSGYKREAFRGSQYAAKILDDAGIRVSMKSDHSAIVSRYLLHEAQQAHHFGLPAHTALSSVTTTAAGILGLDHRIGYILKGYDADIVIWDSHPLALGATPLQVFIDGLPQLDHVHGQVKPANSQAPPATPNYDAEAAAAVKYSGVEPLQDFATKPGKVVFSNVASVWTRSEDGVQELFSASNGAGIITVDNGRIIAAGFDDRQLTDPNATIVDLQGGSISPGIVSAGSSIGLQEIAGEETTVDGVVPDPLAADVPALINGSIIRAVDGLQFATRDALRAYRAGVTTSVTFPPSGFLSGLGVAFSLGAPHKLAKGAVVQKIAAVHVVISSSHRASVSTQFNALRHLILDRVDGEVGEWFGQVAIGLIPLVVKVHSADIIATLLDLKAEIEGATGAALKVTILGGAEAHLVADDIKAAGVGVIVEPRSFPHTWESRRVLPGAPLGEQGLVAYLVSRGITVGVAPMGTGDIGPMTAWAVKNTRWDAGWIALDANWTRAEAYPLVTSNVEKLLGVHVPAADADLVATRGGDLLSFEGKVVAVVSARRGVVDIL